MSYLLFDIGGSKMRFAISPDLKTIRKPEIVDTPRNFAEAMKIIAAIATKLSGGEKIQAAAGGIPGEFDVKHEKLYYSPNLPLWLGKPIKKEMERAIGARIYSENDATIVGLGEAIHGAGKGYSIVTYFTISTGVGGARIVNGHIDEKSLGWEPGQDIIAISKTLPKVSNPKGTHEGYVSGAAISKAYETHPYEIKDPKVWETLAEHLAVGLHNSILFWSPDVVVLGGSMIVGRPRIDPARVAHHLKTKLSMYPKMPAIKEAKLGAVGGLYGAMEYLKQNIVE